MSKISVCIATYNGEKYIEQQISSILKQIKVEDEVIISDDCSSDNTIQVIEKFNDPRIRIYTNAEKNRGYSKNFENAIQKATGDIIFIADQDDVWKEGKVRQTVDKLDKSFLVVSDAEIVDEHLNTLYTSHFKLYRTRKGFWINFMRTRYIGACMAFKKEILDKALPFPENQRLCAYDYWLANVSAYYYDLDLINTTLIKYRRHTNNASSGGEKSTNSFLKKLATRIYVLIQLVKRKYK